MESTLYSILKHAHSGIRWIALIALIYATVNALIKWQSGKEFQDSPDKKLNSAVASLIGLQFLIGIALYFVSAKVDFAADFKENIVMRFFTLEHPIMMFIAVIVISIGSGRAKKMDTSAGKFKTTFIFFAIGLALILWYIPWPFGKYGGGWG